MGDSLTIVVVILLAAGLMFVFPMMALAERNDEVAQLTVQSAVTDFVNDSCAIGKITNENFDKLIAKINATYNDYDTSMEVQILDDNAAKFVNQGGTENYGKLGENVYYSVYTPTIMDDLDDPDKGVYLMKEGDRLTCTVSNTNQSISQMFKNFFYGLSGSNVYSIVGSYTGMSTCTGHA